MNVKKALAFAIFFAPLVYMFSLALAKLQELQAGI